MCGIAGFVNTDRSPADGRIVRRMTDIIAHRGPDGSGCYVRGEVALGHRRLSIIDLATGGQPMSNEDDSVWITYNGEIFNHADIRPELEAAGHRYKSHCDTETIVHAYEQWGDESVTRYRGMFSYAIWAEAPPALLRPRPPWHQALLLLLGRTPLRFRLRDQGPARASRHQPAFQRCSAARVSRFWLHQR